MRAQSVPGSVVLQIYRDIYLHQYEPLLHHIVVNTKNTLFFTGKVKEEVKEEVEVTRVPHHRDDLDHPDLRQPLLLSLAGKEV